MKCAFTQATSKHSSLVHKNTYRNLFRFEPILILGEDPVGEMQKIVE